MTTEIVKIGDYDEYREKFKEVESAADFLPNVSTKDGYDKSKRVALDVGKILTALDKKRKELKAESLATGRAIDGEAKSIVAVLESYQLPHKEAYKKLDQDKKDRETDRKSALTARCEVIEDLPVHLHDECSGVVKAALENLIANECLDFYEFTERALKSRNVSRDALSAMFATKLQQEKDAKELKGLQAKSAVADKIVADAAIAKDAVDREVQRLKVEADAEVAASALRMADREHISAIRSKAKSDLMAGGITEDQAKAIVMAIHSGKITSVSITY